MDNHEVIVRCHLKVNSLHLFLGLGLGPRILKEKGKFGLFAPKPNIRVCLGVFQPKRMW